MSSTILNHPFARPLFAALLFAAGCDSASLGSASGGRAGEDATTHIEVLAAAACQPGFVTIADGDITYCVHEEFCVGRVGDFCAEAPKDVLTTDDVQIWSDTLFWCRAAGVLEQSGPGAARIAAEGGEYLEHGAAQVASRTEGCVSNPSGHGLRDATCDVPPTDLTDNAQRFGDCSADGDAVECRMTAVVDHRGTDDQRFNRFEALTRRKCGEGECAIGDGRSVPDLEGSRDNVAFCGQEESVLPTSTDAPNDVDGDGCTDKTYQRTPIYTADTPKDPAPSTLQYECVAVAFCFRPTTAEQPQYRQFCEDAPIDVINSTQWGPRLADEWGTGAVPGQVITAGNRLITCSDGTGSVPLALYDCLEANGAGGECIANSHGMACRDATAEGANPTWADVRDCGAECAAEARQMAGDTCSEYKSNGEPPRVDRTKNLTDIAWSEIVHGATGKHERRLEVFGYETCATSCVSVAGGDDTCSPN